MKAARKHSSIVAQPSDAHTRRPSVALSTCADTAARSPGKISRPAAEAVGDQRALFAAGERHDLAVCENFARGVAADGFDVVSAAAKFASDCRRERASPLKHGVPGNPGGVSSAASRSLRSIHSSISAVYAP
jgi:hypothetical protein